MESTVNNCYLCRVTERNQTCPGGHFEMYGSKSLCYIPGINKVVGQSHFKRTNIQINLEKEIRLLVTRDGGGEWGRGIGGGPSKGTNFRYRVDNR